MDYHSVQGRARNQAGSAQAELASAWNPSPVAVAGKMCPLNLAFQ
eukprot:CAMPEP_0117687138 /NCGR_PEP_ID=MMETSP0804-20121206/22946_1 /TAXON_ID=1074897 /ORGANISM="Tetraselmis astigmatica, Strain CCMP880" /LENGTH=44 /DNA_ID= /DNA_START= /DNA_END= /DNA_ORIENTATION=